MKSVFITGAAHGIGLATAQRFALQGYFVGLYDINREALANVMASGDFVQSCSGYCDVRSRESIDAAFADFGTHTQGRLDVLVNNAGVLSAGPFAELDPQALDLMIDINVHGLSHVAQAGFALLKQTPGACMVNLCSISSVHGIPGLAVYSASKFYVNGLTEALYLEWAEHDIRVTCVKPDLVSTQMGHAVTSGMGSERAIELTPEDVAAAIERAVNGNKIAYVVGRSAKVWALADKLLHGLWRTAFTKRLLGKLP